MNAPSKKFTMEAVFKANNISVNTQNHLSKVYLILMWTTIMAAWGGATQVYFALPAPMGLGSFFMSLGCILWLGCDPNKTAYAKRTAILSFFGFMQGMGIGPLLQMAIDVDPSIILTALLATVAIFASFSLAAMIAKRRSFLYLGGILSSCLFFMILLSCMNYFVQSTVVIPAIHLYGGLLLFTVYVVYDTQLIIEAAENGSEDYVWHAMELFLDFIAIFIRILIILMRSKEGKGSSGGTRTLLPMTRDDL